MSFATTRIDLEIIILGEVSQKQKYKYHSVSLICVTWNLTEMNLSMKQKQIHRENRLVKALYIYKAKWLYCTAEINTL